MLILKCDRCGSLNDAPQSREVNKPPIIPQGGIVEKTGTAPWNVDFQRYDMCERCLKLFDTWMKEGKAPLSGPAIVGKEQTRDPLAPVKLPVEQRATSRVSKYAPNENSLDSQE